MRRGSAIGRSLAARLMPALVALVALAALATPAAAQGPATAPTAPVATAPAATAPARATAAKPAHPAAAATAVAAPNLPPNTTTAQLRELVDTLKDDTKRARLVSELELMLAAQQKAQAPAAKPGVGARVMAGVSERIDAISRHLVGAASIVVDAPRFAHRLVERVSSPDTRARWLGVLWKVVVALLAGAIAETIVRFALRRARRSMEARASGNVWVRLVYLVTWTILDIAPIAAFAAGGYGILPFVEPSEVARLVALALINAIALARAVVAIAQAVFMPEVPQLRVVPISDEDASYGYVWVRRIANVTIYGWMLAEAALLLGLAPAAYDALIKVVGLIVALLAIVLVLQTRHSVGRWLAGQPGEGGTHRSWGGLRARLADVWHVIAIVYVAGMYAVWALEIPNGFAFVGRASLLTVVILIAARLAAQAVRQGSNRMFAISEELRHRYPGLEARANRYLAVLQSIAVALVYIVAAFAILASWGINSVGWIDSETGRQVMARAILIAGVVAGAVVAWELLVALLERALNRREGSVRMSQRARTLLPLARTAIGVVLTALAGLTILSELGINIGPLLAGAGVIGLAVGFGSQTLVKDLVTGIFILSEDQIAVGDVVTAGGHSGLVESLSIRTVRLRGLDGNVHIIPYSEVTAVENFTKDYSRYVFSVGIAYREDVDEVAEVLKGIGKEMQDDPTFGPKIIGPLEVLGLELVRRQRGGHQGAHHDPAHRAVVGGARVQPAHEEEVRRAGDRDPVPTPHDLFRRGQEGRGAARPHPPQRGRGAAADRRGRGERWWRRRRLRRCDPRHPGNRGRRVSGRVPFRNDAGITR